MNKDTDKSVARVGNSGLAASGPNPSGIDMITNPSIIMMTLAAAN